MGRPDRADSVHTLLAGSATLYSTSSLPVTATIAVAEPVERPTNCSVLEEFHSRALKRESDPSELTSSLAQCHTTRIAPPSKIQASLTRFAVTTTDSRLSSRKSPKGRHHVTAFIN